MQATIKPISSHKSPAVSKPIAAPVQRPAHKPGPVQDLFEKGMGVAAAAFRIPTNLVSGALIGGYYGLRKGLSADYQIKPGETAVAQVALNTAQGQLNAALTGFVIGGPVGMATNMALDAMGAVSGVYVFVKGGSAAEVGRRLSNAIDKGVKPGEGGTKGALKGLAAGAVSSVKAAAVTGFAEGKGGAAGTLEGASAALEQLESTRKPTGKLLGIAARSTLGVAGSLLSLPAGAAIALTAGKGPKKTPSLLKRLAIASASGMMTGAAVGLLGGPLGMAIGAGTGAVAGLVGPAAKKPFADYVLTAASRIKQRSDDLGSSIANTNREITSTAITGAAAGITKAWNDLTKPWAKPT